MVHPSAISLVVLGTTALASWGLTGVVWRLALRRQVFDLPTDRSLHTVPTPRGGGLAIAVVVLPVIAWVGWRGWIPQGAAIGLVGGGLLIAIVGWLDDLRHLSPGPRIVVQAIAAAWLLAWIGGFPALRVGAATVSLGPAGTVLAFLAILWSTNLYNFMDGIDGLAAGQAVVAGALATLLLLPGEPGLAVATAAIAGASLGFLQWNWPPARIFMGDAGSGLLGFLFGSLALVSDQSQGPSAVVWLFFGGVFVFDATMTLLRRVLRGDRFYQAHRDHAYQRMVRSGWSHRRTTVAALLLSAFVGCLGVVAQFRPQGVLWVSGLALGVLVATYLFIEKHYPLPPGHRQR